MNEKSVPAGAFYRSRGLDNIGAERFESLPTTAGPWSGEAQHGGPPAALLTRAVEARMPPGAVVGRLTMELLGPVPVGPLAVSASVLRPGRSVQLVGADLVDVRRGRVVCTARAWTFPSSTRGPSTTVALLTHSPADGEPRARPDGWSGGYLDAVEWAWVDGGFDQAGAGTVWMRPPPIVEGEPSSPVQRLMACVDSASGVGAALSVGGHAFLNTELSVHVLRPPVGEWVCLAAETTLAGSSVGVATSAAYDEQGLVARSAQALLVVAR